MSLLGDGTAWGIALGVTFELATHILVHYTVPGANFASSLAQGLAPALDGVGLTTVFSETAGEAAVASLTPDSAFNALPGVGNG